MGLDFLDWMDFWIGLFCFSFGLAWLGLEGIGLDWRRGQGTRPILASHDGRRWLNSACKSPAVPLFYRCRSII